MSNEIFSEILIRPARLEDFEQILQIKIDANRVLNAPAYNAEQIAVMEEEIKYWHQVERKQRGTVFVAEIEDEVFGVSSLSEKGKISSLYIAPDCKQRGVGVQLLSTVENEARNRNYRLVSLNASLVGRPFYESCGYHVMGRTSSYSKGVYVSSFHMEKWITSPPEWEKFLYETCTKTLLSIGWTLTEGFK